MSRLHRHLDLRPYEERPPMLEAVLLDASTFDGIATALDEAGYTDIRMERTDERHRYWLRASSIASPGPGLAAPMPWHLPFGETVDSGPRRVDDERRQLVYPFGAYVFENPEGRLCGMDRARFEGTYRKPVL